MTSVTYILSYIDKALAFEWIAEHIDETRFELSFIFLGHKMGSTQKRITELGLASHFLELASARDYARLTMAVRKKLREWKPDIVHSHLREADLIGLTAARSLNIKRRITTRHSSTYTHLHHPRSVRYNKFINSSATRIIAISDVVAKVLTDLEKVPEHKIARLDHGFDLAEFQDVDPARTDILRKAHAVPEGVTVIGVIARHIEWKGVHHITEAFSEMYLARPTLHLVLANARGPQHEQVMAHLRDLPDSAYTLIDYEEDIAALYSLFDVYIHTPIDESIEAFGQTYVEALAAGVPSVFTLSGIAHEFIKDGVNALVVPHASPKSISEAVTQLLENEEKAQELKANGPASIAKFNIALHVKRLMDIYQQL